MFDEYYAPLPDLGAYLARIGLAGLEPRQDLETLTRVMEAHVQAVPFENLDACLGHRAPDLTVAGLFDKVVTRRRGGWCHELNGLLLPLLLAAALVVGGAVLKEPLVRDRGFRFALYGGCGLLFAVEIVRILVCWKPAAAYVATVSTAESVMISRYADLSAVAWPLETVRWIVLAAVVAAWLVWGMQAYRHAKKN